MPKHFFFDLDNTLTRSKSLIEPLHAETLRMLTERADVIVVSGHPQNDIRAHLGKELDGKYFILAQNGNFAQDRDGAVIWEHRLSDAQKGAIHAFIKKARAHLSLPIRDENDIVEDRGCEIAYSLIGHHEKIETKEAFDPDHKKRAQLLADLQEDVEELARAQVDVVIGGTTVLDFIEKGKNKGYNITQFVGGRGWNKSDCIYFGDALFPGGNDETVIGIIPTKPVADYRETYSVLTSMLAAS